MNSVYILNELTPKLMLRVFVSNLDGTGVVRVFSNLEDVLASPESENCTSANVSVNDLRGILLTVLREERATHAVRDNHAPVPIEEFVRLLQ